MRCQYLFFFRFSHHYCTVMSYFLYFCIKEMTKKIVFSYSKSSSMLKYIVQKYLKGVILAILFFCCGYFENHSIENGLNYMVCIGILVWMTRLMYLFIKGEQKKGVNLAANLVNLLHIIWYVISLKPLRVWIRKMRHGLFSAEDYPYLALYGSIVDTYAMMGKFKYGLVNNKAPVAKAALWRLIARGVVEFAEGGNGEMALKVGEWKEVDSAGLDLELERTVYRFMQLAAQENGIVIPKEMKEVVGHFKRMKKGQSVDWQMFDIQYQFADLLNTRISLNSYSKRNIRNIYGMRNFLKNLPSSFEQADFRNGKLELQHIWPEYMAYAYLFGLEGGTLKKLRMLLPDNPGKGNSLLMLLTESNPHRTAIDKMMKAVGEGVPEVEDAVAGKMGRFTFAWHVDEIYDI